MKLADRFWAKVCKTPKCWIWRGAVTGRGHGNFFMHGVYRGAHIVAWELLNGKIPTNRFIRWACGNRRCVRHLVLANTRRHSRPVADRFWEKVDKTRTCWLWTASLTDKGYGKFGLDGRTRSAHTVAWELTYGKIPRGLCVLHKCDVRRCVRHLFLGTKKQNSEDMVAKKRSATGNANGMNTQPGRRSPGGKNGMCKLTAKEVKEIRRARLTKATTLAVLARRYNVSPVTIWRIEKNVRWKTLQ